MSFERIPRVAIVGDGLSSDDLSWLSLHGALNVVVLENQERPEDVFNASPDVLQQAWETVRLVLEYGAAAVELDAIVRRIRERRGRKVRIEVSKPPALYQLPTVDLGKRGDEGGAVGSDDPADGYFDEVRRALGGIDADRPDEAPSQSRAALQFGFPRRWFDWEERWDVPSFSIGRSVAELRAAAEAGDVEAARELLGELDDGPADQAERERWLRWLVERDPDDKSRLALAQTVVGDTESDTEQLTRTAATLRELQHRPLIASQAKLELARALRRLGQAAEAGALLDSLVAEWTAPAGDLASLSDLERQSSHDHALLELARLEYERGRHGVGERLYTDCLGLGFENVRARAVVELATHLRDENRALEAGQALRAQIARSPVDACAIGDQLSSQGDINGAIEAYGAAARHHGVAALRLGRLHDQLGSTDDAIRAYEFAYASRNMLVAAEAQARLFQLSGTASPSSQP